jgi:hypothetical protein
MAIKVNNVTAIDDSRNVSAAGIATVGSGNSTITINGLAGIMSVGTGITMQGIPGNISIAGTLTAAGLNVPVSIVSISPAIGATSVSISTSIVISFNTAVSIAATGFLTLRTGSAGGSAIATFGVGQLNNFLIASSVLNIVPPSSLPAVSTIFTVIPSGLIKSTSANFVGLNTAGANSHSFTTLMPAIGSSYEGGRLICANLGNFWIVAPSGAEVSRDWYSRGDANTRAQQVTGSTGWFVPTCAQLQNPGYVCRTYWDSYSSGNYWSDTFGGHHTYNQFTGMSPPGRDILRTLGRFVNFTTGTTATTFGGTVCCIRAFRCVSY